MNEKIPITGSEWWRNLHLSLDMLDRRQGFLFCGYLDGDAMGTMLALGLYLRLLGKRVFLVQSEPLHGNLEFLEEIAQHNRLTILESEKDIEAVAGEVDTVVFCDTANQKLVPFFSCIQKLLLDQDIPVMELDHHFGTDSAPLSPEGTHLFRRANATSEIAAEILQTFYETRPDSPDPFNQRNILISMLTGLISDTGGGNVAPMKEDYQYWVEKLGNRLQVSTYSNPPGNTVQFNSPADIHEFLKKLSDQQSDCVELLLDRIESEEGIGFLNLMKPVLKEIEGPCRTGDPVWFGQVMETLLNLIPEKTGKVGMIFFSGHTAEGDECVFLKLRRSDSFKYDLRNVEQLIREAFGNSSLLGGGGHPGAVSFRLSPQIKSRLLEGIRKIKNSLIKN